MNRTSGDTREQHQAGDHQGGTEGGEEIVQVEGLNLTLTSAVSAVHVLRGVRFSLHRGERMALVGPSGSGKSSLLFVLAGLEPPGSGRVLVAGTELAGASRADLTRHRCERVGVVFQNFHLIPTMTAIENVVLPMELAGHREVQPRGLELLERVGLSDRSHHFPSQLSGGEQQRVAIARALVASPQLVLADEPTGNLDQGTSNQIMDLLFEQTRQFGSSLLIVTHDPDVAARCDRALRMEDGTVVEDK